MAKKEIRYGTNCNEKLVTKQGYCDIYLHGHVFGCIFTPIVDTIFCNYLGRLEREQDDGTIMSS